MASSRRDGAGRSWFTPAAVSGGGNSLLPGSLGLSVLDLHGLFWVAGLGDLLLLLPAHKHQPVFNLGGREQPLGAPRIAGGSLE